MAVSDEKSKTGLINVAVKSDSQASEKRGARFNQIGVFPGDISQLRTKYFCAHIAMLVTTKARDCNCLWPRHPLRRQSGVSA